MSYASLTMGSDTLREIGANMAFLTPSVSSLNFMFYLGLTGVIIYPKFLFLFDLNLSSLDFMIIGDLRSL